MSQIPFAKYWPLVRDAVKPVVPLTAPAEFDELVQKAARLLGNQYSERSQGQFKLPGRLSFAQARNLVKSLLTVRDAGDRRSDDDPVEAEIAQTVDAILEREARTLKESKKLVDINSLKPVSANAKSSVFGKLYLHRGDITLLSDSDSDSDSDTSSRAPSLAITNAANSALLGCFRPDHPCIDNAIHAAAGPQLRDVCAAYMTEFRMGPAGEPVGTAVITPSYGLKHRGISHVIHTVGPQIGRARVPSQKDRDRLASCYRSTLEASLAAGVKNLALCSISTGIFGYPVEEATNIAVRTVVDWLESHDEELQQKGLLERVIFDVFSERDEAVVGKALRDALAGTLPALDIPGPDEVSDAEEGGEDEDAMEEADEDEEEAYISSRLSDRYVLPPSSKAPEYLAQAVDILKEADVVLLAAGAGLSAAAGLDYTSEAVFRELFPAMTKYGFRRMYDFIGFSNWPDDGGRLRWGYLLSQIHLAAYQWPNSPQVYGLLMDLATKVDQHGSVAADGSTKPAPMDDPLARDYFVVTSNVDNMFLQNGFEEPKIFTPQGNYRLLQCFTPCTPQSIFPMIDYIKAAQVDTGRGVDPSTQRLLDINTVPKCRICQGPVMMNVRGGDWFIEDHFRAQREAFVEFIENARSRGQKLAILEIGSGFNTPSVIRWPCERIAGDWGNRGWGKLIRINRERWEVPKQLFEQGLAVGIGGKGWGAGKVLKELHQGLFG